MPTDPRLLLAQAQQFIVEEEALLEEQFARRAEMARKGEPTVWRERLIAAMKHTLSAFRHHHEIIEGWMGPQPSATASLAARRAKPNL